MPDVLFYHLTDTPLERTLPELLERSLGRGWRCVVQAGSAASVARMDDLLWTYSEAAFLPHGTAAMGHAAEQPIFLTETQDNPAGAQVAMLVDGARFNADAAAGYERTCLFFNGHDADAVADARDDWRAVKAAGLKGTYWAQENGRWTEKAKTA